jgi:hypothetical protein
LSLSKVVSGVKVLRQVRFATKAMQKMSQSDALTMRNHLKLVAHSWGLKLAHWGLKLLAAFSSKASFVPAYCWPWPLFV